MKKRIAIIGAGFTGLTAAYELSKEGYDVTVYEKGDTLGGLVAGFQINGKNLEKAYHFQYKTDKDIMELIEELGISDKLKFYDSSIATYYGGKMYPMMTPIDLIKFTPLKFVDRIRAGLVVLLLQFKKDYEALKFVTAYDWMMKWAGKNVVEVIWEPLLRGKFDKYYNKVAMTFLWSRIQVRAKSKERGDSTEKLGYYDGGWITIINRLVEEIEGHGGEIIFNVQVDKIRRNEKEGIDEIVLGDEVEQFDAIISTTPSYVFSKLIESKQFPIDYLDKLNSIDYIGVALMIFSSDEEITPYYWHNINDLDQPFLVLINLTALIGTDKFDGKNVYYIADYIPHDHEYFSMSEEDIEDKWLTAMQDIFPEMDRNKVDESYVFRFKNAQHIAGTDFPRINVPFKTPVEGIYLSNFTQIYPEDRGTNFAVRDGKRVAQEVSRYLDSRKI